MLKSGTHADMLGKLNVFEETKQRTPWQIWYWDTDAIQMLLYEYASSDCQNYYRRVNPKYGEAYSYMARYLVLYKYGGLYLWRPLS